jgi:hypothetical protein
MKSSLVARCYSKLIFDRIGAKIGSAIRQNSRQSKKNHDEHRQHHEDHDLPVGADTELLAHLHHQVVAQGRRLSMIAIIEHDCDHYACTQALGHAIAADGSGRDRSLCCDATYIFADQHRPTQVFLTALPSGP